MKKETIEFLVGYAFNEGALERGNCDYQKLSVEETKTRLEEKRIEVLTYLLELTQ